MVGTFQEKVVLVIETINKSQKQMENVNKKVRELGESTEQLARKKQVLNRILDTNRAKLSRNIKKFDNFQDVLALTNDEFKQFIQSGRNFNTVGGKF